MRLPKRGEKGFTLIELLIVVAILGVLAAVVIPNVGRFIGKGQTEAASTELANIQSATISMMVDRGIAALPAGQFVVAGNATDNMSLFPHSVYRLYGANVSGSSVNYVVTEKTTKKYYVDAAGTVTQVP